VASAAEAARRDSRSVPPADALAGMGWLPGCVVRLALLASARHEARGRVRATVDGVVGSWQTTR
jgi:hypothetical protein